MFREKGYHPMILRGSILRIDIHHKRPLRIGGGVVVVAFSIPLGDREESHLVSHETAGRSKRCSLVRTERSGASTPSSCKRFHRQSQPQGQDDRGRSLGFPRIDISEAGESTQFAIPRSR
jgi:hypothetical protein